MPTGRALAAGLLLSTACGGDGEAVRAASPAPPTAALRVAVGAVSPVAYAWDGAGRVPWTGGVLYYGEVGRDAHTELYLPFDGGDPARALAAQAPGWSLRAPPLEPGPGRFGGGARLLGGAGGIVCDLPEHVRESGVWSFELWLRPEALGPARVVELEGVVRVDLDERGRLWASLTEAPRGEDGKARVVGSSRKLEVGKWSHLGVVVDVVGLRGMRMVLDGEVSGVRVDADEIATPGRLVLGDGLAAEVDELRVVLRSLTTSELREHWRARPGPCEEFTLFLPGGATERREYWSRPTTDGRVDAAEEWAAGGRLEHLVGGADGLRWTEESWRRVVPQERPLPRTAHPTVMLGDGSVLVHGGETRDTDFGRMVNTDDTWLFDLETEEWRRVAYSPAPSPRCHVPAAYSPDHDLVLLAGGWRNDGDHGDEGPIVDDYWLYRVAEERWERGGVVPEGMPLLGQGLVYLTDRECFLMTTRSGNYLYWPERDAWEALPRYRAIDERGKRVDFAVGASTVSFYDPVGRRVFVFGGSHGPENDQYVDTTAVYDVDANTYTVLDPRECPSPRVRGGMAYDSKRRRFVYFGGVQGQFSDRHDDLWTFDPTTAMWREVPRGQGRPSARGGYYGMAYDTRSDRFVLPMGRCAHLEWADEVVVLHLDDRAPGRGTWVLDRAGVAGTAWSADADTPNGSSVAFRFRTSEDGTRFGAWSDACPREGRFLQVEVTLTPGPDGAVPHVRSMGF